MKKTIEATEVRKLVSDEFTEWATKTSESKPETIMSMFNFAIYTMCSMPFMDRVQIAFEILMGKQFFIHVSKDQVTKLNKELVEAQDEIASSK